MISSFAGFVPPPISSMTFSARLADGGIGMQAQFAEPRRAEQRGLQFLRLQGRRARRWPIRRAWPARRRARSGRRVRGSAARRRAACPSAGSPVAARAAMTSSEQRVADFGVFSRSSDSGHDPRIALRASDQAAHGGDAVGIRLLRVGGEREQRGRCAGRHRRLRAPARPSDGERQRAGGDRHDPATRAAFASACNDGLRRPQGWRNLGRAAAGRIRARRAARRPARAFAAATINSRERRRYPASRARPRASEAARSSSASLGCSVRGERGFEHRAGIRGSRGHGGAARPVVVQLRQHRRAARRRPAASAGSKPWRAGRRGARGDRHRSASAATSTVFFAPSASTMSSADLRTPASSLFSARLQRLRLQLVRAAAAPRARGCGRARRLRSPPSRQRGDGARGIGALHEQTMRGEAHELVRMRERLHELGGVGLVVRSSVVELRRVLRAGCGRCGRSSGRDPGARSRRTCCAAGRASRCARRWGCRNRARTSRRPGRIARRSGRTRSPARAAIRASVADHFAGDRSAPSGDELFEVDDVEDRLGAEDAAVAIPPATRRLRGPCSRTPSCSRRPRRSA